MAVEKEIEGENVGCGYSEVFLRRPAFRSPRPGADEAAPSTDQTKLITRNYLRRLQDGEITRSPTLVGKVSSALEGAASSAPGRAGAEKTNDALGPNHDPIRLLC